MREIEERVLEGGEPTRGGRDRGPRVAFAANHSISPLRVTVEAYRELIKLPEKSTILLRHPRNGDPGLFEVNLATMARNHGLFVEWFEPKEGGRDQVYNRDFEMVLSADYVIAYFVDDEPMQGGTGHVVDAAIMKGIQVTAYTVSETGDVEFLGEFNPME